MNKQSKIAITLSWTAVWKVGKQHDNFTDMSFQMGMKMTIFLTLSTVISFSANLESTTVCLLSKV